MPGKMSQSALFINNSNPHQLVKKPESDTVFQILKFKLSSFRNRFHNGQPQHPKTKSISSAKYKSLIRISIGQIKS